MTSQTKSIPHFHKIKAIFEGYGRPAEKPPLVSRSVSQSSRSPMDGIVTQTDQSKQNLLTPEPANPLNATIETVIEAASQHNRPKLNTKPSWIGRLSHTQEPAPGTTAMSRKITIQYQAPDLLPPVYITTSLSEPQWDTLEMDASVDSDGVYIFRKDFEAVDGEYQYKFRLGTGDWWVCDDNQPTIDDDDGNCNNVIIIGGDEAQQPNDSQKEESTVEPGFAMLAEPRRMSAPFSARFGDEVTPLADSLNQIPYEDAEDSHLFEQQKSTIHDMDEPIPLLKHEKTYPGQAGDEQTEQGLRSPNSSSSSISSREDLVCPEADPTDPSLSRFPTQHSGIVDEIHRAQIHLPEDVTNEELSPPSRQDSGLSLLSPLTMPSVQEEGLDEADSTPPDNANVTDFSPTESASTPKPRLYNHSHGPACHHRLGHQHPSPAKDDMQEEKKINERELLHKGDSAASPGGMIGSFVFATAIVVIAVVVYTYKTFVH